MVTEDGADEEKQTVHGRPPPCDSRYPAAQRLQESAGARLGLQACSSSCILFLKAAPDKTALFIALSAFALCLSKTRPCLPITKLSSKQAQQKSKLIQAASKPSANQITPKMTFHFAPISTNVPAHVLPVNVLRSHDVHFSRSVLIWR